MIIDVCPVCGEDCIHIMLLSNPPRKQLKCTKCGWTKEETESMERVPYVTDSERMDVPPNCRYCSNHPVNGGSGICHCILGNQTITC